MDGQGKKARLIFSARYKKKNDADLVALILGGDKIAFQEILDRYQAGIYGFAYGFLKDAHEAEDVSQEVFLRLYRTAASLQNAISLRAYLFRMARNLCIDHVRKLRPETPGDLPEPVSARTPLNQLCSAELRAQIDLVLDGLPDNQRAAIFLRHEQGMSYAEISESLGVTPHAVESLLTRARKSFRTRFKF